MSITTDLDTIKTNLDQAEIALKYRQIFKAMYTKSVRLETEIDEIILTSKFNAIPTDVKQALNGFRQAIKTFNSTISSDTEITELLNWGTRGN